MHLCISVTVSCGKSIIIATEDMPSPPSHSLSVTGSGGQCHIRLHHWNAVCPSVCR